MTSDIAAQDPLVGSPEVDAVRALIQKEESRLARIRAQVEEAKKELYIYQSEKSDGRVRRRPSGAAPFVYETVADSSPDIMEQIKRTRSEAHRMLTRGNAFSFLQRKFMSQEDLECSLPTHMAKAIALRMLEVFNRHVEIEASRTSGGFGASHAKLYQTWSVLENLAWEFGIELNYDYERLRAAELSMLDDFKTLKAMEKEEERERRAQLREEALVQKELERERAKLEKDLEHHWNAMVALEKHGDADGIERIQAAILVLEEKIKNVDVRALNIRTGYVYVISNIGAFGPDIVKIGMTRRLEPMDRINELSSAAVPYRYDVHALFFSNDAVGIETALHQHFQGSRVNQINRHKEFFRTTPAAVREVLEAHDVVLVDWVEEAPADEYRLNIKRQFKSSGQEASTA
jgi:hypothetical protein